MTRKYLDRGGNIAGIEKTARDSRVPYSFPRSLVNVGLRDGRISRRNGLGKYSGFSVQGLQLGKHTATISENISTAPTTNFQHSAIFKTPLSYGLLKWHEDFQPVSTADFTVELVVTLGDLEELVSVPWHRKTKRASRVSR